MNFIILGAGAPHAGETPTSLQQLGADSLVLDWQVEALGGTPAETIFVGGYASSRLRPSLSGMRLVENTEWQETGALHSLLLALSGPAAPCIVCYGDILFRTGLVKEIQASDLADSADVIIAYDSHWRPGSPGGQERDRRTREKICLRDGRVLSLGYALPQSWASGEFIGLARFSAAAVTQLQKLAATEDGLTRKMGLAEAVEYLRISGLTVRAVDVQGDWVEVRSPRDIAHFVLGTKAETLFRLRGVLESAVIQDVYWCSVAQWCEDRAGVLAEIRSRHGPEQRLVVRSSAGSEDTFSSSNAGGYESILNITPDSALEQAIDSVIASFGTAAQDDQVLIQPMLADVAMSGVAFTRTMETLAPWYVINYETNGSTKGVTSGTSSDHLTLYVRRGTDPVDMPTTELSAVLAALQEIEGRLNYDALDIEFAVNSKGRVIVFQVRPIAVKPEAEIASDSVYANALVQARSTWDRLMPTPPGIPGNQASIYGVMPDWNPAEIIGTAPGALSESLYRFLIMDDVWATQRAEYGYRDVRPNPLLVSFAGRPYVDVRASFASLIPAEIDDDLAARMLRFYLEWLRARPHLHDKVEFDVVATCLAPGFELWESRFATEAGFTSEEIARIRSALHGVTVGAFVRCRGDLDRIDELAARHARIMKTPLAPIERARILLEDCRRYGTLPFAHLARSGFVAMTLLKGAVQVGAISEAASASFLSQIRTVSHDFTHDALAVAEGGMSWEDFVRKFGHLRPGTYDITLPRYDANAEVYLRPQIEQARKARPHQGDAAAWEREHNRFLELLAGMDLPSERTTVETFLRQAIEGREYAKFVFSRNLSDAIEALAEVGAELNLSREILYELPLSNLLALRDTQEDATTVANALGTTAAHNAARRRIAAELKLPPLLRSPEEFDVFVTGAETANFVGQTNVIAEVVDLEHASAESMPAVEGRIALIPQADPGYDWLFGQGISGLVTMFGGANSHMAIRAAEFGLPAAIGIGEQRYRELSGARMLRLEPGKHVLQVVA